jgi:hypothetical protein
MLPESSKLPKIIIIVGLHPASSLNILHQLTAPGHIRINLGNQWLPLVLEVGILVVAIIIVGEGNAPAHHCLLVLRSELVRSHLLLLLELVVPVYIHSWDSIHTAESLHHLK